jgi:hypothetical protein
VARARSSAIVAATKTVSVSDSTASVERTPTSRKTAAAAIPTATGHTKLRFRLSSDARRQAMSGPTPIRNRSPRKSGTLTWLKNGAPTLTFTPRSASDRSGKTVPKNTVKVAATSSTLLSRNADSRETTESSSPCAPSASQRHASSPSASTSTTVRNDRKNTPMEPWVKACTEAMTPERVRKVPNSVSANVMMTRARFQSRSMRRRSWIITECRNAVPVSQGMNAAFSTGSHAQ